MKEVRDLVDEHLSSKEASRDPHEPSALDLPPDNLEMKKVQAYLIHNKNAQPPRNPLGP